MEDNRGCVAGLEPGGGGEAGGGLAAAGGQEQKAGGRAERGEGQRGPPGVQVSAGYNKQSVLGQG